MSLWTDCFSTRCAADKDLTLDTQFNCVWGEVLRDKGVTAAEADLGQQYLAVLGSRRLTSMRDKLPHVLDDGYCKCCRC